MLKVVSLFVLAAVLCSACASTGSAGSAGAARNNSAAAAEDAAMAALAAMDGKGSSGGSASSAPRNNVAPPAGAARANNNPGGTGTLTQASSSSGPRAKPVWVDTPDAVYPRSSHVAAVGFGESRDRAERDALVKLTAYFGQSVKSDLETISRYNEKVRNGVVELSEDSSMTNAINISVDMDTVMGAELADTWYDPQGRHYYAAAIMEREKTSLLYANLIQSNDRFINRLTNITPQVRNSLDGYSRYLLAADVADASLAYARVLTLIGNTHGIDPASMKKGDDYRVEAAELTKNIPIGVVISGDKGNRIRSAFAKAISGAGFRSGGTNSRYILRAAYTETEAVFSNQPYKFVRYQVNGGLEDVTEGSVLIPFDTAGREGHQSLDNAKERALQIAERKIAEEFQNSLKEYLTSLLPAP